MIILYISPWMGSMLFHYTFIIAIKLATLMFIAMYYNDLHQIMQLTFMWPNLSTKIFM